MESQFIDLWTYLLDGFFYCALQAQYALHKYRMDGVIANELHTRKAQLLLITRDQVVVFRRDGTLLSASSKAANLPHGPLPISQAIAQESTLTDSVWQTGQASLPVKLLQTTRELEAPLVEWLARLHEHHIGLSKPPTLS